MDGSSQKITILTDAERRTKLPEHTDLSAEISEMPEDGRPTTVVTAIFTSSEVLRKYWASNAAVRTAVHDFHSFCWVIIYVAHTAAKKALRSRHTQNAHCELLSHLQDEFNRLFTAPTMEQLVMQRRISLLTVELLYERKPEDPSDQEQDYDPAVAGIHALMDYCAEAYPIEDRDILAGLVRVVWSVLQFVERRWTPPIWPTQQSKFRMVVELQQKYNAGGPMPFMPPAEPGRGPQSAPGGQAAAGGVQDVVTENIEDLINLLKLLIDG